ncbi:mannosyl-oligosaccharide alpha-1,2-mannosidase IA-like [Scaptodrosophila lebanonensis]|uniref:alpha-1,2-Mannosidase n=1 Tax=Drosophila lebanonensis TaxID=7225 RepID=A0A6J2TM19_DROLE|nr:mannosyl-oligosaccharide alpha-1,2-mannosidase IA-like [Scaptodrosophila lebanonensis]
MSLTMAGKCITLFILCIIIGNCIAARGRSKSRMKSAAPLVLPMGATVDPKMKDKALKVIEMMKHAWNGYKKYAWGWNEVKPVSQKENPGSVFGSHPLGLTIVDSMDTLYLMGLKEEYEAARMWVEQKFSLEINGVFSVFETNIRYLGGFLTLFAFTGDPLYKNKAQMVAEKLLPAFRTATGIPYALVNFKTGAAENYNWAAGKASILAEFGTLHLEFAYLSDITGDPKYLKLVQAIRNRLKKMKKPKGLYFNYVDPNSGQWGTPAVSLGGLGDSFYEYLLKSWIQSNKADFQARQMYDEAMEAVMAQLLVVSDGGLTYLAEMKSNERIHKMDHLACFAGGMIALGAHTQADGNSKKYMNTAIGITNTCRESYIRTATKLGPETFRFKKGTEAIGIENREKEFLLRPETVESYFILWRLTHDRKYRDWGWEVVEALEKHCRTAAGYSGLRNVYDVKSEKDDVQQSFFLSETLKYLYLLFTEDSTLPFSQWVFSTEAHPLPIKIANKYYRATKMFSK